MITEDYVSFETAKLLKEKGFDCKKESITAMYREDGKFCSLSSSDPYYYDYDDFDEYDYIAPTLQMAMKWLREEYDLHIIVYPWNTGDEKDDKHWCCQVYESFNQLNRCRYTNETVKSYEEACEAAIKYCLEILIEIWNG